MKNIFKAVAEFQQEVPVILKDSTGYGYNYADLASIFEVINPIMKKHGLGFYQAVNGTKIKTVVFHSETGETIESETDIPQGVQLKGMNDFQVLGSAITYIKRYALSSLLGLVTDKDDDSKGKQVQVETKKVSPEVAMVNAKNAINEATTLDGLNEVIKNVGKSKILTDAQKQELQFMYQEKSEGFDPTK